MKNILVVIASSLLLLTNATEAKILSRQGSTGVIELHDDWVRAQFFKNDTILHATDAPNCVAWIRSTDSVPVPAGSLKVGGGLVGKIGGPTEPVFIHFNPEFFEYSYFIPSSVKLFQQEKVAMLYVQTSGKPTFPSIPLVSLQTAGFHILSVINPVLVNNGLTISSKNGLAISWVVPNSVGSERVGASLFFLFGNSKVGELRCGAPVLAGKMTLPASLLSVIRNRLSPLAPIEGAQFRISLGDQKELQINGGSFFFEVSPTIVDDSAYGSTFGELLGATLD